MGQGREVEQGRSEWWRVWKRRKSSVVAGSRGICMHQGHRSHCTTPMFLTVFLPRVLTSNSYGKLEVSCPVEVKDLYISLALFTVELEHWAPGQGTFLPHQN